jgi:transcriptional regulator with XRE-family HTH domain
MDTPEMGIFAELLIDARHSAGYTQEDLADKAKVSIRTIGNLERGVVRSPRPSTVRFLAEALNLDAAATTLLHSAAHQRRGERPPPGRRPAAGRTSRSTRNPGPQTSLPATLIASADLSSGWRCDSRSAVICASY